MKKVFKNKNDLVEFIKIQLNVELQNDNKERLNRKRNILYTQINHSRLPVLSLLNKYKIRYESHMNDYYWIYIK